MPEPLIATLPAGEASYSASRLVEEARAYAPEAWAHIFDEYHPRLFRYCLLRTGDRATAEDLAADVLLEALRGIGRYRYRGTPLSAWLYRIARNLTADHLKSANRQRSVALDEGVGIDASDTSGLAETAALRHDVQQALAELTDEQQQVIILRFYQDLSHEETAAAMGRRPGAVRALQHRALRALRRLLAA